MRKTICLVALTALALPVSAKDSLGVYSSWAAFRDADTPRCYAIAKPRGRNANRAFASIGTWPKREIRNQVHFRLSRAASDGSTLRVRIDTTNFDLVAQGRNAWAPDAQTDAAIVAALRSASAMRVNGGGVSDRYNLSGVATAMDAAIVGCADL
ncbi:hypothetical protein [Erythrobacter crassostreae]|uniref:Uncharacterized protein n=1 Tax=Erythrobacter crassostreae TaxID=2828328 RepID=A0A9X1JNE4_9SPHN|nr:hypothetical protein [Erythrobacter crassostrea]MBV7260379.1 hypothetical protein [Erythrobacter crassostrea]